MALESHDQTKVSWTIYRFKIYVSRGYVDAYSESVKIIWETILTISQDRNRQKWISVLYISDFDRNRIPTLLEGIW